MQQSVLENIERSESLPATVSATSAFESVIGALVQRLPATEAADFVDRRLPRELSVLLQRDAEEALEDGAPGDLKDYIDEVSGQLELEAEQTRELATVVIGSMRLLLSAEEVEAFARQLSPQLATMWLSACRSSGASTLAGE